MPELPDVDLYVEQIARRVAGTPLLRVRLASPFVLRTFSPSVRDVEGRAVVAVRRIGKRIVLELEDGHFIVIHLMVAGRFRWRPPAAKIPGRLGLAAFDFEDGTLLLTEASTKKRASIHIVKGEAALLELDPGGIDPCSATAEAFREALTREPHTVKRALTDPHLFSGIGNAYSDEILWRAKLSPTTLTTRMSEDAIDALRLAVRETLVEWTARLRSEAGDTFPEHVTAFRPEMAVHGKYQQPCPACGDKVQRIRYADNESNYCATCQTGGKLLRDRGLSRLLRDDWPKTLDELETRKSAKRPL